jgi:hypothetical protein
MAEGRVDYLTHYKYVTTLERLSTGLSVKCSLPTRAERHQVDKAAAKIHLIELTYHSIKDELAIVEEDEEYSTASVLWLPIKTYYLIYHLLSVIDFFISGNSLSLTVGHNVFIERFTQRLESKELILSESRFDTVFQRTILEFRETSGEHLRSNAGDTLIHNLVMKKIGSYKLENRKINNHWNLRLKKDQAEREKFLNKMKVSIFDFFYLMRIKSNYSGFNFIEDIPATDTARYFRSYFRTAENFRICFQKLREELEAQIRSR